MQSFRRSASSLKDEGWRLFSTVRFSSALRLPPLRPFIWPNAKIKIYANLHSRSFLRSSTGKKTSRSPCGILGMSSFYCRIENYGSGKEWPELPRPSFFYVSVANWALPLIQIPGAIP